MQAGIFLGTRLLLFWGNNSLAVAMPWNFSGVCISSHWNSQYGCRGTVTACCALIALIAWKYLSDSILRKLSVHPKYG